MKNLFRALMNPDHYFRTHSIVCVLKIVLLFAILLSSCEALITTPRKGGLRTKCGYHLSTIHPPFLTHLTTRHTNMQLFDQKEQLSQQPQQQISDVVATSPPPQEPLKKTLLSLAAETKRGFIATSDQRSKLSSIITKLSECNPTTEPANAYYDRVPQKYDGNTPTLAGKWTLVYTDAPDITGLDPTMATTSAAGSALPRIPSLLPQNAKLGRIGQECIPEKSLIKNVIEWKRPDWMQGILNQVSTSNGDDGDNSRVLQKVCCEATASPIKPTIVELKLSGFELEGNVDGGDSSTTNGILSSLQEYARHGPAAYFEKNPLNLSGPLKAPFGQFECLYLDKDMRIIRTGQGFFAVNVRQEEMNEWF